ncbi:MAG: serine/threonine-protein kinase [Bacteroidetes bacterium]|nr:serine/threonine-protein kinase [Bacteroidota bacterium]
MVGKSLSHYKILEELGRGGMGIVYKAEDVSLDRIVAIKVLPASALASEIDRARFYREAKASAKLNHPNIASVYQIDEAIPSDAPHGTEPSPFIAMEFIQGETLEDRVESGPLKLDEAVEIATQVAEGLQMAHGKNVVHRDIKSANVMLDETGRAKILDFGLAQTAASTKLTAQDTTLGTIAYMSPEQARGEEVDLRTDIWALGVVLYEMISGMHPFPGEYQQAVVYSILNQEPEPLTALRTGVPMALEEIVSKCLSKNADLRYQGCAELLVDLKRLDLEKRSSASASLAMSGVQEPISVEQPIWRRFSLPLVALLLLAVGYFSAQILIGPPDTPTSLRWYTLPVEGRNPEISSNGRYVAYVKSTLGVSQLYIYDLETRKDVAVPEAFSPLRTQFSPDENHLFYSVDQTKSFVVSVPDLMTGTEVVRPTPTFDNTIGWTTDGNLVYRERGLRSSSLGGADPTILLSFDAIQGELQAVNFYLEWIEEHELALVVGVDSSGQGIHVLDARKASSHLLVSDASYGISVQDQLIYLDNSRLPAQWTIQSIDFKNRQLIGTPRPLWAAEAHAGSGGPAMSRTLAVSSNGVLVRNSPALNEPKIFSVRQGLRSDFPIESRNWNRIRSSPDGRKVAIEDRSAGGSVQIVVAELETGNLTHLTGEGNNQFPVWTPDGERVTYVAFGDSTVELRERSADGSGSYTTLFLSTSFIGWPDWSRDGNRLAFFNGNQERVRIYDRRTNSITHILADGGSRPIMSPDGRYVASDNIPESKDILIDDLDGPGHWVIPSIVDISDIRWSPDGTKLYHKNDPSEQSIYEIPVSIESGFRQLGPPRLVYDHGNSFQYDLLPDGAFVGVELVSAGNRIEVATGWLENVQRQLSED